MKVHACLIDKRNGAHNTPLGSGDLCDNGHKRSPSNPVGDVLTELRGAKSPRVANQPRACLPGCETVILPATLSYNP